MKVFLTIIAVLLISGCAINSNFQPMFSPTEGTSNPAIAAVYVGTALIVGKLSKPCSYGHPDDKQICKKAKDKKVIISDKRRK